MYTPEKQNILNVVICQNVGELVSNNSLPRPLSRKGKKSSRFPSVLDHRNGKGEGREKNKKIHANQKDHLIKSQDSNKRYQGLFLAWNPIRSRDDV